MCACERIVGVGADAVLVLVSQLLFVRCYGSPLLLVARCHPAPSESFAPTFCELVRLRIHRRAVQAVCVSFPRTFAPGVIYVSPTLQATAPCCSAFPFSLLMLFRFGNRNRSGPEPVWGRRSVQLPRGRAGGGGRGRDGRNHGEGAHPTVLVSQGCVLSNTDGYMGVQPHRSRYLDEVIGTLEMRKEKSETEYGVFCA